MDKISTAEQRSFWLEWQTWPDAEYLIRKYGTKPYVHPYGFTVVRLSVPYLEGWQARVHFWVPTATDAEPLKIHRHGSWDLHSRVLIGSVRETRYAFEPSINGAFFEYTVTKSQDNDVSTIQPTGRRADVTEEISEDRTSKTGLYSVDRYDYHSTECVEDKFGVTLALTKFSDGQQQSLIMSTKRFEERKFINKPQSSLQDLIDSANYNYQHENQLDDQWASFVFVVRSDKVLMARTRRDPSVWMPIGGRAKSSDRQPVSTAVRELAEEAGLGAAEEELYFLGTEPRDIGAGFTYFWTIAPSELFQPRINEAEFEEVEWFSIDECRRLELHAGTLAKLQDVQRRMCI